MIKEIIKKIVGKFDFKNKKILKECVVMKNEVSSYTNRELILSILVDTFISKISLPMQPVPEIRSISGA